MKIHIVEEKETENGEIGYTDFTAIYLNKNLISEERELVRIHELSHIWLGHNLRRITFVKKHKKVDKILLNLAMDLEIAKHIYDRQDERIIGRENSLLHGAISKKDCEKYLHCQYFEEYYLEIEKNHKKLSKSWDAKHNKFGKEKNGEIQKNLEETVKEAIEKAKKRKMEKSTQENQQKLKDYKIKPSFSSEIDSIAGRQKVKRVKSYRRPNRIERSDFFQKGEISKRKTPTITVYVDRSGSFDESKTQKATEALQKILKKYRGQIKKDTFYFNDDLLTVDPVVGSGGTNHQIVVDEILQTKSELSVIITDNDYGLKTIPKKLPRTIVVPIGCRETPLARSLKIREFILG